MTITATPPTEFDADCLPRHDQRHDQRALRNSLGAFATGVCIVTARSPKGEKLGVTVNSFSSVSLDPPLVLVCLAKSLFSHDDLVSCNGFTVSVLRQDQAALSTRFAARGGDKWNDVDYRPGRAGGLILEPHLASFDCVTHARQEGGDHTILLGRVLDFSSHAGEPLLYFRGGYNSLAPAQDDASPND